MRRSPRSDRPAHRGPSPVTADVALALNGMGSFVWDLATGLLRYDEAALDVLGIDPAEFDGDPHTVSERMLPQELPALRGQIDRALAERTGYSCYFRVRRPDGTLRWTHTQAHVVCDEEQRPLRVIGIVRDASQELRAVDRTQELRQAKDERRRQAGMVRDVTDALARTVTVEDVAQALTAPRLLGRLGAGGIVLGLVENARVRLVGSRGVPDEIVHDVHVAPLGEALPLSEAIRTRRPTFLTDRSELGRRYPRLRRYLPQVDADAFAYLPLIAHDTPIGALGLAFRGKHRFTHDERTVLSALSGAIAQSLQRALLYDHEHEVATGLQTAMLPGHLPRVPGLDLAVRYRPAGTGQDIGGDWYDAVPLPDGRVATVVGDVQGHDVRAAAVMGQLRIALRAYAAEGHPPSSVMARASAFLTELDTDRFATCLLVTLDPLTGIAEVVRAGHLEPLVRHPDGGGTWLATPGGLPLGLVPPTARLSYPATEVTLAPGAAMVLCTDGLIESRTTDIDHGRRQLLTALHSGPLRPEPLADHLLRTMAAHTGLDDDVALLLVRRPREGRPATRPHLATRISAGNPESLHKARQELRTALRRWSLESVADTAELLASELATNALLHAGGNATLTAAPVRHAGRSLRLEVTDTSPVTPHRRAAPEGSTSGRGMLLVEELAQAWGVEPRGTGKCVWCEITAAP